jgi:hypothetical protein
MPSVGDMVIDWRAKIGCRTSPDDNAHDRFPGLLNPFGNEGLCYSPAAWGFGLQYDPRAKF